MHCNNVLCMTRRNILLGALEAEVMELAWTRGEVTVHDVSARLKETRAYTTVQTTLDRLFRKALLSREKRSHAFVYSPRCDRAGYHRLVMENVLPEPGEAVLTAFVDLAASADPENLRRLEELIEARKRSGKPRKSRR